MIALCFQTCDRFDLTERTLRTFAAHNDLSKFDLLHADDASEDGRIGPLVTGYGFRTVVQTGERLGVSWVRTSLIRAALRRKVRWVLLLENDIETIRPFPWELFSYVNARPWIYCLRLYGRYKDLDRAVPCLTTHKRREHKPVTWRAFKGAPEASQIGEIHWSAQPAVTRMQELWHLHNTGHEPEAFTVRVKKNVMAHIGHERTPGRIL